MKWQLGAREASVWKESEKVVHILIKNFREAWYSHLSIYSLTETQCSAKYVFEMLNVQMML